MNRSAEPWHQHALHGSHSPGTSVPPHHERACSGSCQLALFAGAGTRAGILLHIPEFNSSSTPASTARLQLLYGSPRYEGVFSRNDGVIFAIPLCLEGTGG
jgi:hypothetical protein